MKLIEIDEQKNKLVINKNAIGLHYEQDYHSHNFKADIFKEKIKCSRQFKGSISSETFEVTPKEQMMHRRNMAEDFEDFKDFMFKDMLAWFYKKKHYTKGRF